MFEVTTPKTRMGKNKNLTGQPILCQILSLIPRSIVDASVAKFRSDYYYKTMTTYKQLCFMLYGVVTKCPSLNSLCKNLQFLDDKLIYLDIDKLPAVSTLSDANINRNSDVFGDIYLRLTQHYSHVLKPMVYSFFDEPLETSKAFIIDSSTISLFVNLFKGAGRNSINGKKKGGLKIHTKLPLGGFVPDVVFISPAACNDRDFLGQLKVEIGGIYIFDKGYVNFAKWLEWSIKGAFFLTRLNENANYTVLSEQRNHISEYADGGLIADQIIVLKSKGVALKARLVTWKDYESGVVLQFVTNMFEYQFQTIVQLYKCRWAVEVFYKRVKQNFEVEYFYSDSTEGIKTQIWIALIANLIFTVIHRQCKEAEVYVTVVSMAASNMASYMSLIAVVTSKRLVASERDIRIIQLDLFASQQGGTFQKIEISP
jgi:hypothetical protein